LYTHDMSIPNIDTFEHDIAEEIKNKEATIGDIAAASGEIGNTSNPPTPLSTLVVSLGILFLIAVAIIGVILFMKYSKTPVSSPTTTQTTITPPGPRMSSISPTLDSAIGASVGNVERTEYGYVIEILSYSDVFAYMLKNENRYADELAESVGSPRDTSTTTIPFAFSDVTMNNQNMRVGTSGSSSVVYAFVNTSHLLISPNKEGILSLRSAILR
jgi:hypothetical protein